MARKKVRFLAKVDGRDREVFAIAEGADGDLAIMRRPESRLMANPSRPAETINFSEHRVSVHISRKSSVDATTIVHTQIIGEGVKESGAALVKNSRKSLCWPVFSVLCPDLRDGRYDLSLGKTRKLVYLSENIPDLDCLMYHVFAFGPERDPPDVFGCSKCIVEFRYLKIVIYINYLNMPNVHFGTSATLCTTDVKANGESRLSGVNFGALFPGGGISFSDEDVRKYLSNVNHELAFGLIKIIRGISVIGSELYREIENHKIYFSRYPMSVSRSGIWVDRPPEVWNPTKQG